MTRTLGLGLDLQDWPPWPMVAAHSPEKESVRPGTTSRAAPLAVVGANRPNICTFCGRPSSATVSCPDKDTPILWQIGICDDCLTDCVMARFVAVKHERMVQLAHDTAAAASQIRAAREKHSWEPYERRRGGRELVPQ